MKNKSSRKLRHLARSYCVQLLYQCLLNEESAEDVLADFWQGHATDDLDGEYLDRAFSRIMAEAELIDKAMSSVLDRSIASLDPVERAILRLAVYEFQHCLDVPYKVVINEAVELAKEFGAQDGHKYVNAILDKLALVYRQVEIKK
jgi:transcription antitermination protein NusB